MVNFDKTELARAAEVIKIKINEEELVQLHVQFVRYLQWLETLLAVDCREVKPILFSHGAINVLREDKAEKTDLDAIQRASLNFEDSYYVVPPIIE